MFIDWSKERKKAEAKAKRKARRRANKSARKAASPKAKPATDPNRFYLCRAWRELRYKVLKQNDGRCELCGASKHEGATLHVDHILPRSKFPKLQLEETNLQVLCSDCNIGKSNTDVTDWRKRDDEWAWLDRRMDGIES